MRCLTVFAVLFFGVLTQAHSNPTLVVTSSQNEGGGVRYFYTVSNWTTNDPEKSHCGDPNWGTVCIVLETIMFDSEPESTATTKRWGVRVLAGDVLTMGDILRSLNNQGVFNTPSRSVLVEGYSYNATCIKLELATGLATIPFTSCAPVKAPPVKCDLYGKTNIDHGTLSDNAVEGADASTSLNLSCSGSTSLTVKATRTNSYGVRLRNDNSLYSEVKINQKDATNGISVVTSSNGSAAINVTSTLRARGTVVPGGFSGSTVITVSPN
jgi:hypothetical protein